MLRLDSCDIDAFTAARDVLNSRWKELAAKYPEMTPQISFELAANAADVVAFVNMGQMDESECPIPVEDARDILLLQHVMAVDSNESGAAGELHTFLANELHRNTLTVAAFHLLAAMHSALSHGMPADEAMLTKPPGGRPNNADRDARIRRFMQSEDGMRELMAKASPPGIWRSKADSFKEAARIFDVRVKTIRNIVSADPDS